MRISAGSQKAAQTLASVVIAVCKGSPQRTLRVIDHAYFGWSRAEFKTED